MMTPVKSRNGATGLLTVLLALLMPVAIAGVEDPVAEKMRTQVQAYFDTCFADLEKVAGGATVKGDANCGDSDGMMNTVVEINASLI